jgi:plastocyanin domain-containing protein
MNKTALIIISIGLLISIGFIFTSSTNSTPQIEIKNGVQYVTIDAKGGYSPQVTEAKGDIPTKLIMKTNGTYDCSAALVIKSINYQKILPQNGETEIDLGIPKKGVPLRGVCGMGMYSFVINFT